MKKSIGVALLAVFVFSSCNSNQRVFQIGESLVSRIPDVEKTITASETFTGPCFEGSYSVYTISDSVLVLNIRNDNHIFRAFNTRNNSYVDFMGKGRGPDEVVTGSISGVRTINDTILIDVVGINEQILYSIDFNSTIKEGKTVIRERMDLIPETMSTFILGDDLLSEVIYDDDIFSLKLHNRKSQIVSRMEQPFGGDEYLAVCQTLLGSVKRVKPDGALFCMAMIYFNEVNIFDIKGNNHISVSISKHTNDLSIVSDYLKNGHTNHIYYWGGEVSDNAIYALYYNCDIGLIEDTLPVIHVFSWDGQLKAIYHLNESLRSITISKDGRSLYGVSWDEVLYRYELD